MCLGGLANGISRPVGCTGLSQDEKINAGTCVCLSGMRVVKKQITRMHGIPHLLMQKLSSGYTVALFSLCVSLKM